MSQDPAPRPAEPSPPSDEGPSPRGLRELWAPRISVAVALLLALAYAFLGAPVGEFCLDDAWIHLAYAKSLRLGDGLSYNPGDWETGFSSPLWVALLAAWPSAESPEISVKLLGALLHAATAGLASSIALDLGRARASIERPLPLMSIALLAGCLCATSPVLVQGASSGMEVPLTTCLVLGCLWAALREQWLVAGVLGFAAELARPEALAALLGFCVVALVARLRAGPRPRRARDWRELVATLSPVAGAGLGLGAWMIYCQLVSGWPWPNTAYVKSSIGAGASLAGGLAYVWEEVLPWEPYYAGVGGLALILAALWTDLSGKGVLERGPSSELPPAAPRWELLALLLAYLAGMLATAQSRPLEVGILFFQARYFAIFAPLPPILVALGVARTHRWLALILVLPVAVLTGLQLEPTHGRQRAQERGVALLHGDPAAYVSRELPADAVIAVEGAGAMRAKTPRTMEIVDVIGLNDAAIAHAEDDAAKACVLVAHAPDYMVLPVQIAAALERVFELRPIETFVDPAWAQVEEPYEVRVVLVEVVALRSRWRERCGG